MKYGPFKSNSVNSRTSLNNYAERNCLTFPGQVERKGRTVAPAQAKINALSRVRAELRPGFLRLTVCQEVRFPLWHIPSTQKEKVSN
jgi:hypothetical protein